MGCAHSQTKVGQQAAAWRNGTTVAPSAPHEDSHLKLQRFASETASEEDEAGDIASPLPGSAAVTQRAGVTDIRCASMSPNMKALGFSDQQISMLATDSFKVAVGGRRT